MPARRDEGDKDDLLLGGGDPDKRPIEIITDSEDNDGFDTPPVRKEQREVVRDSRTGRFVSSDDDDGGEDTHHGDDEFAYSIDDEDDEYASSRRQRRNRNRRARQAQDAAVIGHLQHEIGQLRTLVGEMGRGQVSIVAGEIDNQIATEQGRLSQIDAAIAEAIKNGDTITYQRGQQLRDEARERIQGLQFHRRRIDAQMQDTGPSAYGGQPQPQPNNQQQNQPDPRAQRLSEMFMERFPWFDPTDPGDDDSREVVFLEGELARKGSNPASPKHWQRLEKLVRERNLGADYEGDDDMDDYNDKPRRRARPGSGRSSGSPAGSSRTFRLDATMKEALDAEGLLDAKGLTEDQLKRREKLVRTWQSGLEKARKEGKL